MTAADDAPSVAGHLGEPSGGDDSAAKNMLLLVQLRWTAIAGQVVTIAAVWLGLGIDLPLLPMAAVLACLVILNIASIVWLRSGGEITEALLFGALLIDVVALTAQLYLSGGITNPFTCLFLLQVTLAAVLLDRTRTAVLVAVTVTALAILSLAYRPITLPSASGRQLFDLYLIGASIGFILDAALVAVFVTRIARNLQERDARLAALRQRAAEEDHIVRMGLLASGAAHELGTPLSQVAVVLGDWRRLPAVTGAPDMLRDIDEMEDAIARCKAIVTGILLAAGAPRGEASHATSVRRFVTELAAEWRQNRSCENLNVRDEFGADRPIASDAALKQVVLNVLDNAFEVSPNDIIIELAREQDAVRLSVLDRGPGFDPEVLERFGEPYMSTKGRLGGGLGLFLALNVVRKLGGTIEARNRDGRGAEVTISLPIDALAV